MGSVVVEVRIPKETCEELDGKPSEIVGHYMSVAERQADKAGVPIIVDRIYET